MDVLRGIVNLFRFDKTNWKAVSLCLSAATVFWFFNALNKEHTATISYPVEFQYDKAVFIPVKELPHDVMLNITGPGWELLRKSLGYKIDPLRLSLEHPSIVHSVLPSTVLAAASTQLGQTKINHVASDTLVLSIDHRKTKKVKLVVDPEKIRFREDFGFGGSIIIAPDSVLLEGPSSILSKTSGELQLKFSLDNISKNVSEAIDLQGTLGDLVLITPYRATVSFDVSELVVFRKKLKVVIIPSPPFKFQNSSDSVFAKFRLPSRLQNRLDSAVSIFAVVDLKIFEPGIIKVVPEVKGIPIRTEVLSVDSITIRKY